MTTNWNLLITPLRKASKGASFVELAIAIPVFVTLLAIIVDMSRILSMYAAMNYAVHRAASDFSATPVEEDTIDPAILNRYLNGVESFLVGTFFTAPSVPSLARLVAFDQPGLPLGTPRSATFLRPSESATYTNGGGATFSHPLSNAPGPLRSWANVLATAPFLVHAEADVRSVFLPWFSRRLSVTAYAYRRSRNTLLVIGTGFGSTPTPPPTSTNTPTPTPTPTPTGGGPQTPTPTPTPTITPTPHPCPCYFLPSGCCTPLVIGCCQGGN